MLIRLLSCIFICGIAFKYNVCNCNNRKFEILTGNCFVIEIFFSVIFIEANKDISLLRFMTLHGYVQATVETIARAMPMSDIYYAFILFICNLNSFRMFCEI